MLTCLSLKDEPLRRTLAAEGHFNAAFYVSPLTPIEEDWSGFPVVAYHGDPPNHTPVIAPAPSRRMGLRAAELRP